MFLLKSLAMKPINVFSHAATRETRQPVVVSGSNDWHKLFYVWDRQSKCNFLSDTDAEVSVLPATRFDRHTGRSAATLRRLTAAPSARGQ